MRLLSALLGRPAADRPRWLEPEALAAQLASDAAPLVIDVRGPDEFDGPLGHIKGALNVPLPELNAQLLTLVQQQRPLVTVCRTDRRSAVAAGQLQAAGATAVTVLRGGMERWRALRK